MSIKITSYQNDTSKLQADVHYQIGKKKYYKRWLVPTIVYSSLTTGKKEKACIDWAQNKLLEIVSESGKSEITCKTTLDQFYPKWLEWLGQNVKASTVDNYDRAYKNHVKPFWGNRELVDLSDGGLMIDYKTYLTNKTRKKVGKKLAVSSKNNIQACLMSICGLAHSLTLISYKPKIKFERQEKTDLSDKKYSLEQQETILKCAKTLGADVYAAFVIGLDMGLRRGEVIALEWNRVFLDAEVPYIDVKYNMNVIKGIVNIGSTKGGKAAEVAMSARVVDALRSIKPEKANGRVFDDLMPWDLNNLVRQVLRLAHKKDKEIVISANFHKFRHNCASNLADKQFYITKIKDHLRHSSLDVTSLYIHTGSKKETKEMLDLIGKPAKKEKLKLVK